MATKKDKGISKQRIYNGKPVKNALVITSEGKKMWCAMVDNEVIRDAKGNPVPFAQYGTNI